MIKECVCSLDTEQLVVGLHPCYMLRELFYAITIVYIPPLANTVALCDATHSVTTRLQTKHRGALKKLTVGQPLGRWDHILVHLLPFHVPFVKRLSATVRTVREWSKQASAALQKYFESTDWNVIYKAYRENINDLMVSKICTLLPSTKCLESLKTSKPF